MLKSNNTTPKTSLVAVKRRDAPYTQKYSLHNTLLKFIIKRQIDNKKLTDRSTIYVKK